MFWEPQNDSTCSLSKIFVFLLQNRGLATFPCRVTIFLKTMLGVFTMCKSPKCYYLISSDRFENFTVKRRELALDLVLSENSDIQPIRSRLVIRFILANYQMKSVKPALREVKIFKLRKVPWTVFVHDNQGWGNFAVKGHRHLHHPPLHQRHHHRPCLNQPSSYLLRFIWIWSPCLFLANFPHWNMFIIWSVIREPTLKCCYEIIWCRGDSAKVVAPNCNSGY